MAAAQSGLRSPRAARPARTAARRSRRVLSTLFAALILPGAGAQPAHIAEPQEAELPRYEHIFLIIAENRSATLLENGSLAPHLSRLARQYGRATRFYGEVHPSEGNYVAMLAGSTFGIHDDDPWYCKPGTRDPDCAGAGRPGYPDHSVYARTLIDQLEAHGLTWKAYMESLPEPGSLAVFWPTPQHPVPGIPAYLYAAKHNAFVNSVRVRRDAARVARLVGFDQLDADLAAGTMPHYAQIVPNQCNDMHGLGGADVPLDCRYDHPEALIARGDRVIGELVDRIMRSAVWHVPGHVAIVITFDEGEYGDAGTAQGCCGYEPGSLANFGGGHVPTIVVTNHGPRGVADGHSYNHYSLLRTTERAFGIFEYLGHAADVALGVASMSPLFAASQIGPGHRTVPQADLAHSDPIRR